MQLAEVLEALLELADEVGLDVRVLRGDQAPDTEFPPTSACCRVKGKFWVMLSPNDPVELHVRVLGEALKNEAAAELEDRFLPPAIRHWIDGGEPPND
jgi:hypothetical protein